MINFQIFSDQNFAFDLPFNFLTGFSIKEANYFPDIDNNIIFNQIPTVQNLAEFLKGKIHDKILTGFSIIENIKMYNLL